MSSHVTISPASATDLPADRGCWDSVTVPNAHARDHGSHAVCECTRPRARMAFDGTHRGGAVSCRMSWVGPTILYPGVPPGRPSTCALRCSCTTRRLVPSLSSRR